MYNFSNFFKFNLYIYTLKHEKNSLSTLKSASNLLSSFNKKRGLQIFLNNFFYYLYNFFRYSINKVLLFYTGTNAVLTEAPWLYTLVQRTGSFFTQKWLPGIITNYEIAKYTINKYGVPQMFYTRPGLIILFNQSSTAINEAKGGAVPALVLKDVFLGHIMSINDFSYFITTLIHSIWYLSKCVKL